MISISKRKEVDDRKRKRNMKGKKPTVLFRHTQTCALDHTLNVGYSLKKVVKRHSTG